ncbi:nucleotidyl transferase [bacterium]|nr:nucleotidyl transferase [bacterium]
MRLTAIIPAAGVGTRLRPHTHSRPKALLPVAGNLVLGHILDQLIAVGVDRVVLVVGYRGEMIADWVAASYPGLAVDSVLQEQRLGLGHAVYQALLGADGGAGIAGGRGLIVLGDTIVRADFAGLLAAPGHAMGVKAVADPRRFGVAVVEAGRIVDLEEKPAQPRSDLALVGIYAFQDLAVLRAALASVVASGRTTRGEVQLTDALQLMIEQGEALTPFAIADWFDVGKEETWLETNRALLDGLPAPAPRPGVRFLPPVFAPASAQLADCTIGPYVSLGEGCAVSGGRLENSIVGEGARVRDCLLHDSLIGADCLVEGLRGSLNLGDHSVVRGERPPA